MFFDKKKRFFVLFELFNETAVKVNVPLFKN